MMGCPRASVLTGQVLQRLQRSVHEQHARVVAATTGHRLRRRLPLGQKRRRQRTGCRRSGCRAKDRIRPGYDGYQSKRAGVRRKESKATALWSEFFAVVELTVDELFDVLFVRAREFISTSSVSTTITLLDFFSPQTTAILLLSAVRPCCCACREVASSSDGCRHWHTPIWWNAIDAPRADVAHPNSPRRTLVTAKSALSITPKSMEAMAWHSANAISMACRSVSVRRPAHGKYRIRDIWRTPPRSIGISDEDARVPEKFAALQKGLRQSVLGFSVKHFTLLMGLVSDIWM